MTNRKQSNNRPPDDRALDALLDEAFGRHEPPDLSDPILLRLHSESAVGRRPADAKMSRRRAHGRSPRPAGFLVIVAAIAAVIMAMVWFRWDDGGLTDAARIADSRLDGNSDGRDHRTEGSLAESGAESSAARSAVPARRATAAQASAVDPDVHEMDVSDPSLARRPTSKLRGEPIVMTPDGRAIENASTAVPAGEASSDSIADGDPTKADPIALVSLQTDARLRQYWEAIGIEAAAPADNAEVVARLKDLLSIDFSGIDVSNAEAIRGELADPSAAPSIAAKWLRQVTGGGVDRLSDEQRQSLIEPIAQSFAGNRPLDELLIAWIDGSDPGSSAFYTAMARGSKSIGDAVLGRQLAALTMNVDLRCTRCHDAYLEGSGRQQDHWSFLGLLNQELIHTDKVWSVAEESRSTKPLFYDLADGRRRVADVAISPRWMTPRPANDEDEPIESLSQWTRQLSNSPRFSNAIVSSLWQMIHGQALGGRVVDPVSPPDHEALSQLGQQLADDLRRSNFDVGRTLSLVIASPATNRQVPSSLQKSWVTDDAKDRAAVEAFAAARPSAPPLSLRRRLDETMRAIGAKLDSDGNPLLAQLGESDPNAAKGVRGQDRDDHLSWEFPEQADEMPVQWLLPIDDGDQRLNHLAYLAGLNQLPASIRQAAEAMQSAGVDEPTRLHRVWWLLK